MAFKNHEQNGQDKLVEAAKANISKTAELGNRAAEAARHGLNETVDLHQANINNTAELSSKAADVAREGISKTVELQHQAAENTKRIFQHGVESVSQQARAASDRVASTLGFSGEDSQRLANQAKQNMEMVTRCGTIMTQAFQDFSRGWLELGQKQWRRNLDGLNKLTHSKSVQEFTAVHSELVREGLQHVVEDSRAIAERSLRAVNEASSTFTGAAQRNPPQG